MFIVGGGATGGATAAALSKSSFFEPKEDQKQIVLMEQAKVPSLEKFTKRDPDRIPDP